MLEDLQKIRRNKGYTLRQIEYKTGLRRSHLHNIETGKTIPRMNEVCVLARAMGLEPLHLFFHLAEGEPWYQSDTLH